MFAHEQPGFELFLAELARKLQLPRSQIEKDYWITHALWALHAAGLEVWFKGGICLSKGYGIIERFSEDFDLKLEAGTMVGIPPTPR
jgi:predicted nucleotidyltransferase component of viral defense system